MIILLCLPIVFRRVLIFPLSLSPLPSPLSPQLLTRVLPLFVAVSALEDLVGIDYFVYGRGKSIYEETSQGTTPTPKDKTSTVKNSQDKGSMITKYIDRMASHKEHDGLPRWKVMPLIGLVLILLLSMCGRLATLEQVCNKNAFNGGKWCYQKSYPLLTSIPGSPSECGCAIIIVNGTGHNNTCDPVALTQLHDDLVNEDRQIAKQLRILTHFCPSQNVAQTENILAAKLDSVSTIGLYSVGDGVPYDCPDSQYPCAAGEVTEAPPTEALLTLPELRAASLLTFTINGVPLALPSHRTLAGCARLVALRIVNAQLVALPSQWLDGNPKLYVTVMYPQHPQHCMLLATPTRSITRCFIPRPPKVHGLN